MESDAFVYVDFVNHGLFSEDEVSVPSVSVSVRAESFRIAGMFAHAVPGLRFPSRGVRVERIGRDLVEPESVVLPDPFLYRIRPRSVASSSHSEYVVAGIYGLACARLRFPDERSDGNTTLRVLRGSLAFVDDSVG